MGTLDIYDIDLKSLGVEAKDFTYTLDGPFFKALEVQEISDGLVHAQLTVKKLGSSFELLMHVNGVVTIQCDRCLDDMQQPIEAENKLFVKFGPEYLDEGDELIIVPEDKGIVNVAWFLYELVALAIPIQHTHEEGQCNEEMMRILHEHSAQPEDENVDKADDESHVDPRWSDLKKLLNNN